MENYTIQQLGVFISVVLSAVSGVCLILHKSKCKSMSICCGLISLERKLDKVEELELEPEGENNV